jgi:cytoskeletal protein CcmA (bactofilin family)
MKMERTTRSNVRIAGEGTLSGGVYHDVKIAGTGTIRGDLDCHEMKVQGEADVTGCIKAQTLRVFGTASFKGNLDIQVVKVFGTANIDGDVTSKEFNLFGSSDIQGRLTGETVHIKGYVTIQGDCEAELFLSSGGVRVDGLLNAETIRMELGSPNLDCQVKEMGGDRIEVRRRTGLASTLKRLLSPMAAWSTGLVAETIEGDDIYLEYTRARIVRGNTVRIGPGCEIERVEYKDQFTKDDGSTVVEHNQSV